MELFDIRSASSCCLNAVIQADALFGRTGNYIHMRCIGINEGYPVIEMRHLKALL